jgi:chromosome segregation ATPase
VGESSTYTEEEFKKILKNLLAEKKRVKELKQELESSSVQKKFQAKLSDIQRLSYKEEEEVLELRSKLRSAKEQLLKVKPALERLVGELKEARDEIEHLKKAPQVDLKEWEEKFEEKEEQLEALKQEISTQKEEFLQKEQTSKAEFDQALSDLEKEKIEALQVKERLKGEIATLQEKEKELQKEVKELEEREEQKLRTMEKERERLVEKLSENVEQSQRQTELTKNLQEQLFQLKTQQATETGRFEEKLFQLKEQLQDSEQAKFRFSQECELLQSKQQHSEKQILQLRSHLEDLECELETARERLKESDTAALHEEYEQKIKEVKRQLIDQYEVQIQEQEDSFRVTYDQLQIDLKDKEQKLDELRQGEQELANTLSGFESHHQEVLQQAYQAMRNLSHKRGLLIEEVERLKGEREQQNKKLRFAETEVNSLRWALQKGRAELEERVQEVRLAQQHLAKKVKESTLMRDVVEKQRLELGQCHEKLQLNEREIEKLTSQLQLQKLQEENAQNVAYQKIECAYQEVKMWEQKFLDLQKEAEEGRSKLNYLENLEREHHQLKETFNHLKSLFGKNDG